MNPLLVCCPYCGARPSEPCRQTMLDIAANVARKEQQSNQITRELVAEMRRVRGAA